MHLYHSFLVSSLSARKRRIVSAGVYFFGLSETCPILRARTPGVSSLGWLALLLPLRDAKYSVDARKSLKNKTASSVDICTSFTLAHSGSIAWYAAALGVRN